MFIRMIFQGIVVFAIFASSAVHAALECTHLVNAAQTAIELRNRGVPLKSVLAETDRDDMRSNFNSRELNTIRQIIRIAYNSEYTPLEVLESCEAGELGIPRKK
jgi:hypothetical protein